MGNETLLDCLYNELINLDEQAGCYDEETNARIDEERRKLFNPPKANVIPFKIFFKKSYKPKSPVT